MESFPATPLDVELYSWQYLHAGDFAPVFVFTFAEPLDIDRLNQALLLLIRAEPVLGCRIVIDSQSPRWQPLEGLPETHLMLTYDADEYERLSTVSPDARVGPQISALLWRRPDSDVLLFKLSHAAGDGSSAIYCYERLAEIYTKLGEDPSYIPPMGTGRRDMQQIRERVPKGAFPGFVRDWLTLFASTAWPPKTQLIGLPKAANDPWHFLTRQISAEKVSALSRYGKAKDATLNDLFLTAYYRAVATLGRWDGKAALRTVCTIDLRRYLADPRPNGVANLSAAEFPYLGRELGKNFDDTLQRVTAVMNKRKQRNPGLAISYLTPRVGKGLSTLRLKRTRKIVEGSPIPTFTNLGRLSDERLSFSGQIPVEAQFLCFKSNLPNIVIGLSGYHGTLTLSTAASDSARPQLEALLDGILAELPA